MVSIPILTAWFLVCGFWIIYIYNFFSNKGIGILSKYTFSGDLNRGSVHDDCRDETRIERAYLVFDESSEILEFA